MTIRELITLASNRLSALHLARGHAFAIGDLERLALLDAEIAETQSTIDALRTLG